MFAELTDVKHVVACARKVFEPDNRMNLLVLTGMFFVGAFFADLVLNRGSLEGRLVRSLGIGALTSFSLCLTDELCQKKSTYHYLYLAIADSLLLCLAGHFLGYKKVSIAAQVSLLFAGLYVSQLKWRG